MRCYEYGTLPAQSPPELMPVNVISAFSVSYGGSELGVQPQAQLTHGSLVQELFQDFLVTSW